jgi:hypothetical protein
MSAVISDCGKYRYWLSRDGDASKQRVAFVMLNPSTADATVDDATIRRCRSFARGAPFVVVNAYAFRATNPKDMKAADDPVGKLNYDYLFRVANGDFKIIIAWGANIDPDHAETVRAILKHGDEQFNVLYCLGVTKDNHPRHPLYVRGDAPIYPWVPK